MASRPPSSSFHKVLVLVFGAAFGLVALALGYQAMNSSADIRSKAAEEQSIYKQWEFNGSDTEGWVSEKPYTTKAQNGYLTLAIQKFPALAVLRNFQVNTKMPRGLKTIAISMAVGAIVPVTPTPTPTVTPAPPTQCPPAPKCPNGQRPIVGDPRGGTTKGCPAYICATDPTNGPTPVSKQEGGFGAFVKGAADETDDGALIKTAGACSMEAKMCPDGYYVGRSGPRCEFVLCPDPKRPQPTGKPSDIPFIGLVYYKLVGKTVFEKPIEFKGITNGKFQEYKITLPDGGDIAIERLRVIVVSALKPGDTIAVDWVRLLGPVVKPSAYPTPTPFSSTTPTPMPTVCSVGLVPNSLSYGLCPGKTAAPMATSAIYVCFDGTKGSVGDGVTCVDVAILTSKATQNCAGKSNCSTTTPRPTSSPTSGPKPSVYMTPTPPPPYFIPAQ